MGQDGFLWVRLQKQAGSPGAEHGGLGTVTASSHVFQRVTGVIDLRHHGL